MKKVSIGLLIFGVFCFVCGFYIVDSRYMGVDLSPFLLMWGVPSVVFGFVFTFFNGFFKNCISLKSLAFAFGISMFTGFGLNCLIRLVLIFLFGGLDRSPIFVTSSLFVGFFSLIAVIVLFSLYIMYRRKNPSLKGVIADVVVGLMYVVPFLFAYSFIYNVCAELFHYYFPNL